MKWHTLQNALDNLLEAFAALHHIVQELRPDDEKESDHTHWYQCIKEPLELTGWLENASSMVKEKEDENVSLLKAVNHPPSADKLRKLKHLHLQLH